MPASNLLHAPATRQLRSLSSTSLLPSVTRVIYGFPRTLAAVPRKEAEGYKTGKFDGLGKSCVQVTTEYQFASQTRLLQFPQFGLVQKRFHGSVASVGGSPFSVPDFSDTVTHPGSVSASANANKPFTYFVVGATGVLGGMAAKSTAMNFLSSLSASGDVLALAQVEIDLSSIPEAKSVVMKWRGKPVFIRHRTAEEIESAQAVDVSSLRDPQTDADRTKKPEWIVMMGVCTHLGCVPVADAGDYGGWYCPCQYRKHGVPFHSPPVVAPITTSAAASERAPPRSTSRSQSTSLSTTTPCSSANLDAGGNRSLAKLTIGYIG